ncbi:hypothetical protein MMC21_006123 [Puttea exsequens]|nr:hypothetical protein [Puttea exsequens]
MKVGVQSRELHYHFPTQLSTSPISPNGAGAAQQAPKPHPRPLRRTVQSGPQPAAHKSEYEEAYAHAQAPLRGDTSKEAEAWSARSGAASVKKLPPRKDGTAAAAATAQCDTAPKKRPPLWKDGTADVAVAVFGPQPKAPTPSVAHPTHSARPSREQSASRH